MIVFFFFLVTMATTIIIIIIKNYYYNKKQNKKFYDYKEIYPQLDAINRQKINKEIEKNMNWENSMDWPEQNLYQNQHIDGSWKIIPFYGFGIWCDKYCNLFPNLTSFLQSIPNLKIALLSKLGPETSLLPHFGWGKHSNHVLRCHYGIKLPNNYLESYIVVKENEDDIEEIRYHKKNDWIVFDDSKLHYAVNNSKNEERIILIIDLERPENIEKGISNIEDTDELMVLIDSMKQQVLN